MNKYIIVFIAIFAIVYQVQAQSSSIPVDKCANLTACQTLQATAGPCKSNNSVAEGQCVCRVNNLYGLMQNCFKACTAIPANDLAIIWPAYQKACAALGINVSGGAFITTPHFALVFLILVNVVFVI